MTSGKGRYHKNNNKNKNKLSKPQKIKGAFCPSGLSQIQESLHRQLKI